MDGTLGTTNALLAILAAVAVLEAVALICAVVAGWIIYRKLQNVMHEVRQQVPRLAGRVDVLAAQLEDVLHDVKDVSARTAATAERVQRGVDTAAGVASMASSSAQLFLGRKAVIASGVVRGLGVAYRILTQRRARRPRPAADAGNRPRPVDTEPRPRQAGTETPSRPADTDDSPRPADSDRNDSTTFKEAAHGS